jgi:hypothetical protein
MLILGFILLGLLIVIGFPMAFVAIVFALHRSQYELNKGLKNPDFVAIRFEKFPGHVRMLLAGKRRSAEQLGFTELVSYTCQGIKQHNFSCVLLSSDGQVYAEIDYVTLGFFHSLLCLFLQPMDFFRSRLGFHGMAFGTSFNDGLRVITSPLSYLRTIHEPGRREMNIVPGLDVSQQYSSHRREVNRVIENRGLTPRVFTTPEDFFSMARDIFDDFAQRE